MKPLKKLKITAAQLNYLQWLNIGETEPENVVLICTDLCEKFGAVIHSSVPPFKTDIRAIQNLYKNGLAETYPEIDLGITWLIVTISDKGRQYLEANHD